MTDALTLRRLDADRESFATMFEHPEFGPIDVGRIVETTGNPHQLDSQWRWTIGWPTLPGRHWRQGPAATQKAAIAAWKAAWPAFRDARSDAEWHDGKAAQDKSEKILMIIDARKVPGLSAEQQADLTREMGRPGPAPHWLEQLLRD